jgi:hypothetical protein
MEKAYVLNLKHRTDRWEQLQKDFADVPLILEQVHGVVLDDENLTRTQKGYLGVAYTHIQLVNEAIERGDKTLLILEDDCLLEPNGWNNWIKIKNYLDNHLDDWEVFNGGIVSPGDIHNVVRLDDLFLVKESGGGGCHFFYINIDKAYQKIMDWVITKQEIDLYYSFHFNYWVSYPLLAIQRNGYSDIGNLDRDWKPFNEMSKYTCVSKIGDFLMSG